MKRFVITAIFCVVLVISIFAEPRNALLIANGTYKNFSSLKNPIPEAELLKKSLIELGFEVKIITNADKETMEIELENFQKRLASDSGIAFFHYGGHAVQVNGENYLIPADADIPDERRVSSRAVNVSEVMASMVADTNIVILDSCRNNPLPAGNGRSASRGLQIVKVKPKNSIIVYSADAGETAEDGVFTPILAEKILENKELRTVLTEVRSAVGEKTKGNQMSANYDQLIKPVNLCEGIPNRSNKLAEENEKMAKQIAALENQQRLAKSQEEKNKLLIEQQRIESEKKLKEIELKQVREAEERRAKEAKRLAEEKAKQNENQKKQEEEIARMQRENEVRQRELDKLLSNSQNVDQLVVSANEIYRSISKIESDFTIAMNKAIDETKTFYANKRSQITRDEVETKKEFESRKKSEEAALNLQEKNEISKYRSDYTTKIKENTSELERKLTEYSSKRYTVTGKKIELTFGQYDADGMKFPFTIIDNNENDAELSFRYDWAIDLSGYAVAERKQVYQNVKNNIASNGYIGYMEYGIAWNAGKSEYEKELKSAGVRQIRDNQVVAEIGLSDIKRIIASEQKRIENIMAARRREQEEEARRQREEQKRLEQQRRDEQARLEQQKWEAELARKREEKRQFDIQYKIYKQHCGGCGTGLGFGGLFALTSIIFIPVGAANAVNCAEYDFDIGVGVSWGLIGAGLGCLAVSGLMFAISSIALSKEMKKNSDLRKKIHYYKSSGLFHRNKALFALQKLDLLGGYDFENDTMLIGMGFKL